MGLVVKTLNLKNLKISNYQLIQSEIEHAVDQFLKPFLQSKSISKLEIIVGKGINSNTYIQGKHQLLFYATTYLDKLGVKWKLNTFNSGVVEICFN